MVSTRLKNIIVKLDRLPQIGVKIINIWNHHPVTKKHTKTRCHRRWPCRNRTPNTSPAGFNACHHCQVRPVSAKNSIEFLYQVPSLKLTACPRKWMVGRRSFPFGTRPIFRGYVYVSFRECTYKTKHLQPFLRLILKFLLSSFQVHQVNNRNMNHFLEPILQEHQSPVASRTSCSVVFPLDLALLT